MLGTLEGAHAEALQAHVAKLVTTAPVGADSDAFLRNVARQAKQLLLYGLFKDDKVSASHGNDDDHAHNCFALTTV